MYLSVRELGALLVPLHLFKDLGKGALRALACFSLLMPDPKPTGAFLSATNTYFDTVVGMQPHCIFCARFSKCATFYSLVQRPLLLAHTFFLMDFILNNHFYAAARPSSRVQVEKGMKGK